MRLRVIDRVATGCTTRIPRAGPAPGRAGLLLTRLVGDGIQTPEAGLQMDRRLATAALDLEILLPEVPHQSETRPEVAAMAWGMVRIPRARAIPAASAAIRAGSVRSSKSWILP
jgi:hypothetical protein